jgi:hypothetical protein
MKNGKPTAALPLLGILTSGLLCQTVHAQTTIESGSSVLQPSVLPNPGPSPQEYLTISWSVVLSGSIYTYNYTVNNPYGDVIENDDGTLTGTSEVVDSFSVVFDTTVPGAVVGGPSGGNFSFPEGASGVFWNIASVVAGSSSGTLSFQSDYAPTMGDASADDSDPPAPWSSASPYGQEVPVPNTALAVPEPETMTMFFLGGLLLLPVRSMLHRKQTSKQ